MREYKDIWVRIAGDKNRIHSGDTLQWRCFVSKKGEPIYFRQRIISGDSTPQNNIMLTKNDEQDPNGLTAWIDYYGDVSIDNDTLTVQLKNPA